MHYFTVRKVPKKPFQHIWKHTLFHVHDECFYYFLRTIKLAPHYKKLILISCALTDNTSLIHMLNKVYNLKKCQHLSFD